MYTKHDCTHKPLLYFNQNSSVYLDGIHYSSQDNSAYYGPIQ